MNLELLDPFEQDIPEVIEDTLEDGPAVTVRFNSRGTLLAAGCLDGTIVVWDFDTRGVSRSLIGHVKAVTCLSWSRNGRYLLSASKDWSCIVWDLLTGIKKHTIRFDTSVLNAQFHPKNNSIFIAALYQEKPVIVDFSNGVKRQPILQVAGNQDDSSEQIIPTTNNGPTQWTLVVTYDRSGKRIYTGSNRGHVSIIDTESRKIIYEIRPTTSSIRNIQFNRKGRQVIVNANDKMIRLFDVKEDGPPEQIHKFQDLINKIQWNQCCFSSDSDYVIGGSAHQAEHNIYIWDRIGGNLVKILEGPKEPLEDLAWHPIRPIVASVSSYGTIHIWATNYQENWSAFAPDFKELEENIDYEEREDEFDIVPEEEASKRKHDDEDVFVDVTTIEKINPFNDSDNEDGEEETFYLPLLPSDQQDEALLNNKRHRRRHQPSHHHHHRSNRHNNIHDGHHSQDHSGLNHVLQHLKHENTASPSPSLLRHGNHLAADSVQGDSVAELSGAEERKRDIERDYDRGRNRERRSERDRYRDRDESNEGHHHHHKQKQRSEDEDFDTQDFGYENGSTNGYDRDDRHSQYSGSNSSRRRQEERSNKRQR
ncbi:hypothetical protein BGZ76_007859 [Entomortierella beljakovae]|nr:hypothetical protein BGZ76_007859 [Entomortierella beljakovae]